MSANVVPTRIASTWQRCSRLSFSSPFLSALCELSMQNMGGKTILARESSIEPRRIIGNTSVSRNRHKLAVIIYYF